MPAPSSLSSGAARLVVPLVGLVALILGLTRLTPREPVADLRVIDAVSIATLDPAQMSWLQDIRVAFQLYEGLYVPNTRGTGVAPGCAIELPSAGKTTLRFQIIPGARWSNGDSVTADDFIFAWRRAVEPGTARDYAFFFNLIRGIREYVDWRNSEIARIGMLPQTQRAAAAADHRAEAERRFAQTGIIREDDRTIRLELVRPIAYFRSLLAGQAFLPLHRRTVEQFERWSDSGLVFFDPHWCKPGNTVYNGAYILADWTFKRGLLLTKNPAYRDAKSVTLNTVEWLDVASVDTAWLMYATGRADWLLSLEAGFAPELIQQSDSPLPGALNHSGRKRDDVHAFPAFGTYFYNFNCMPRLPDGVPNPFADPRVRLAFSMAVDREALVTQVTRRDEPPATALIPPNTIAGYPRVQGASLDLRRAEKLLAEAGYPGGRGFPEVTLLFNNEANHGLIAQSVAAMWSQSLGVPVRLLGKEAQSYREDKKQHHFMIARASWYGDYDDPTTFLDVFRSDNGNNDSAFIDLEYDRMLVAADGIVDPAERMNRLADCERYLFTQTMPAVPLFHYVNIYAFDPHRLSGVSLSPRLLPLLRNVRLDAGRPIRAD